MKSLDVLYCWLGDQFRAIANDIRIGVTPFRRLFGAGHCMSGCRSPSRTSAGGFIPVRPARNVMGCRMRLVLPLSLFVTAVRRPLSALAGAVALLMLFASQLPAAEPPATADLTGTRVALVIGNGAYGDLGTLPNPPNDASDIADALEGLHFKVTRVIDGNAEEMRRALRDFGSSASGADVALFYYAGHGMALRGENYLVPVHAQIQNELDLTYGTLALSDVRNALDYTNANLKMVILDACRDNPLAKMLQARNAQLGRSVQTNEGLAPMDVQQASGMFIAYATSPGNVALDGSHQRNSPFTKALLAHIAAPNTDVRIMFGGVKQDVVQATNGRQIPWVEEAMLGGEFDFNPVKVAPLPPTLPDDYIAWSQVDTDDPAAVDAFIAQHPDSKLVGAARDRLSILRDPAAEAAAWTTLRNSRDPAAFEQFLHRYPDGANAATAQYLLEGLLSNQLLASRDVGGMEAYVARFPDGAWTALVRDTMAQLRSAQNTAPAEPRQHRPSPQLRRRPPPRRRRPPRTSPWRWPRRRNAI